MIQTFITDYFDRVNYKIEESGKKINSTNIINLTNKVNPLKNKIIIRGYNPETGSWHCTECGIDMGFCNPRQLCKKTYCENN